MTLKAISHSTLFSVGSVMVLLPPTVVVGDSKRQPDFLRRLVGLGFATEVLNSTSSLSKAVWHGELVACHPGAPPPRGPP